MRSFWTQFGSLKKKSRVRPKSREEPGCGGIGGGGRRNDPEGGTYGFTVLMNAGFYY